MGAFKGLWVQITNSGWDIRLSIVPVSSLEVRQNLLEMYVGNCQQT